MKGNFTQKVGFQLEIETSYRWAERGKTMLTVLNVIMSKFWDAFYGYKGNKGNKWELCNFLKLKSINLPRKKGFSAN